MRIEHAARYHVCSAHAEVIPVQRPTVPRRPGLLRTRGGDPKDLWDNAANLTSAPHTRR